MNKTRADIISLLFILVAFVAAAVLYPNLPDDIPTHWNAQGEVDDYMKKPWGVWIMPGMALFTYIIMKLIPAISPKGFRTDSFSDVFGVLKVTLVGFMSIVSVLVLLEARGLNVRINEMIIAGVGLLFVIIGNYLGKVRKNFFIGIRTPWTLASDEVWSRTHRIGGKLFMLSGVIVWIGAMLRLPLAWTVGVAVGLLLIPVVYSYFLYRRIEGFESNNSDDTGDEELTD
jgi:uncharacterized membrane protein